MTFKTTTNAKPSLPLPPNLLKLDFAATALCQKWVGDSTYLWTDEDALNLVTFVDL